MGEMCFGLLIRLEDRNIRQDFRGVLRLTKQKICNHLLQDQLLQDHLIKSRQGNKKARQGKLISS